MKKIISVLLTILIFALPLTAYAQDGDIFGVVDYKTPEKSSETEILWSLKFGSNYKTAPSVPVYHDGAIIFMSGNTLYKVNAKDGKTIATATMVDKPNFGYTPVTVNNGMIFCPLNGKIQAFDYKTMKSLWVYTDPTDGQALTEIIYDNGYIYTGFWYSETDYENYVCINTADENKSSQTEGKKSTWTYKSKGGFYWAKAVIDGDYIFFGTDDGTDGDKGSSKFLCLNKTNGKLSDSVDIVGDQRGGSTLYNGRLYFVTKAGNLYSVKEKTGKFDKSSLKKLSLGGASTSTPVIYNSRLYVGVQGNGFGQGKFKVIDADNLTEIYSVGMKGYPQNAPLVSTAYDKIYIYSTYNAGPGGVTLIKDEQGQKTAVSEELFTPEGEMCGYCISNITASPDGTIYYKNDSGYIIALSKKQEEKKQTFWQKIGNFFKKIFNFIKGIFTK